MFCYNQSSLKLTKTNVNGNNPRVWFCVISVRTLRVPDRPPMECPYGRQRNASGRKCWISKHVRARQDLYWLLECCAWKRNTLKWATSLYGARLYLHAMFSTFVHSLNIISTFPHAQQEHACQFCPQTRTSETIRHHKGAGGTEVTMERRKETDRWDDKAQTVSRHTEEFYKLTVWVLKQSKHRAPENCHRCPGVGATVRD